MSISYGGDKITATDGGSLNPLSAIFRNRLIDAGFIINQRGYTSGTSLSAGTYAHDRWKAGAGGATYTFTQGSTGVPIIITITAGSLQQVIEGCNMPEGGTYVLSWTGTAQARFNGGTYGSSPLAVTGIVAGANTTIEFNTGTVSFPQLEVGSSATGFEYRQYGQELALCQRYYYQTPASTVYISRSCAGQAYSTSGFEGAIFSFPVSMRTSPTLINSGLTLYSPYLGRVSSAGTIAVYQSFVDSAIIATTGASSFTAGGMYYVAGNSSAYAGFNAEL